ENLCAHSGGECSHRFSEPGDPPSLALSCFSIPSEARGRPRLCEHHGCTLLFLVLRLGNGGSRAKVLRRWKRQLSRSRSPAWPSAREIAVLVGRPRRRKNPDVVLPALPPNDDLIRDAASDCGRARLLASFSPDLFAPGV